MTQYIEVNTINMANTTHTNKYNLVSVDLSELSWTNNDMSKAFYNCTNLTTVTNVVSNVTNMYQCYTNCKNLTNIPSIPNSVVDLAFSFQNCSNITSIPSIPLSTTKIYKTFDNCVSLAGDIRIRAQNITNATNAFINTEAIKNVYIPFRYANHTYTATYNSFINAGYSTTTRKDGVLLKNSAEEKPVFTINPEPRDALVILEASGYTQEGNSIQVDPGTTITWSVSKAGYTSEHGTYVMSEDDYTLSVQIFYSGAEVVSESKTVYLPVGTYKYIAVGGGGGGNPGEAAYVLDRSSSGGLGGAGGGSGYVKVGTFNTPGEDVTFTIGQGGISNTDGTATNITGDTSGLIITANGGKYGRRYDAPLGPKGGDGGSGGGAGGIDGQNNGGTILTATDGGRGGLHGANGEKTHNTNSTFEGGKGIKNTTILPYEDNAGTTDSEAKNGNPGKKGIGLVSYQNYILNAEYFYDISEDTCYEHISGGGGGGGGWMPNIQSSPDWFGGPGAGGGGWFDGNESTDAQVGGTGGNGIVLYKKLTNPTLYISPTPSDATVTLTADGYTQVGNGICVPVGTNVIYTVSKTGYDTVSNAINVTVDHTLSVQLSESMYTFTIVPTPSDAIVTIVASGYTQQGNSITVPAGTSVRYSVGKTGYSSKTDTLIINSTYSLPVTLNTIPILTINPTPSDATVTLTASGYTQQGNKIQAPQGTVISWSVTKSGYIPQSGTYTMTNVDVTWNKVLFIDGPILITSTRSMTLPAGIYKYICVGGGGSGGTASNVAYSRGYDCYGGGGGGSGYVTAGAFTTTGEDVVFTVGLGGTSSDASGANGSNGEASQISGSISGIITTANGGTCGTSGGNMLETEKARGGNGYSGGGGGGHSASSSYTSCTKGTSGGAYGFNGESSSGSGNSGTGIRNSAGTLAGNGGEAGGYGGTPSYGLGLINVTGIDQNISVFDNYVEAIATSTYAHASYPQGGGGGGGSNNGTYTAGSGGAGGGGYYNGENPYNTATGITATNHGGNGGNGAIILRQVSSDEADTPTPSVELGTVTLTINPTPSNSTVVLTAPGYAQSGNSITVDEGTTVQCEVSYNSLETKNTSYTVNTTHTENVVLRYPSGTVLFDSGTPGTSTLNLLVPADVNISLVGGGGGASSYTPGVGN